MKTVFIFTAGNLAPRHLADNESMEANLRAAIVHAIAGGETNFNIRAVEVSKFTCVVGNPRNNKSEEFDNLAEEPWDLDDLIDELDHSIWHTRDYKLSADDMLFVDAGEHKFNWTLGLGGHVAYIQGWAD